MPSRLIDHANIDSHSRIVGAYLQPLLQTAAALGIGARDLQAAAGLADGSILPAPEALPVDTYMRLLDAGAALSGDDCFGLHVGEQMRLATYAVYGMLVLSCRTFGEAMLQVQRYEVLAHDLGRSSLRVEGELADYVWHSPWLAQRPCHHLPDSVLAGVKVFVDWMAGQSVPLIEVCFTHPAPADTSDYARIFQAPVRFGQAQTRARFKADILGWPVPHADASMFAILTEHAEQQLRARQTSQLPDIIREVKARISHNLSQDRARLNLIAEELKLAPRTLQRKLALANTSFQAILDATRRELAEHYLQYSELTLTAIAFMLGYSEQSAFNHAFKEWTGMSPSGYRQRAQRGTHASVPVQSDTA